MTDVRRNCSYDAASALIDLTFKHMQPKSTNPDSVTPVLKRNSSGHSLLGAKRICTPTFEDSSAFAEMKCGKASPTHFGHSSLLACSSDFVSSAKPIVSGSSQVNSPDPACPVARPQATTPGKSGASSLMRAIPLTPCTADAMGPSAFTSLGTSLQGLSHGVGPVQQQCSACSQSSSSSLSALRQVVAGWESEKLLAAHSRLCEKLRRTLGNSSMETQQALHPALAQPPLGTALAFCRMREDLVASLDPGPRALVELFRDAATKLVREDPWLRGRFLQLVGQHFLG